MNLKLEDKVVVVTGGAGALGAKVVDMLIKSGAYCVIPVRDGADSRELPFKEHQKVRYISGIDLAEEQQAKNFYDQLIESGDTPWAVLNLAGGFGMGKIEQLSLNDFIHQMQINAYTCFNSCRAAIQAMRNGKEGGRIVNIASRPAINPRQGSGLTAYTSSKAAVAAFTQALSAELIDENILINAVAPSIIDTKSNRDAMPKTDPGKWVKPEDIASHLLYLISPINRSTSGAIIPIYGKS